MLLKLPNKLADFDTACLFTDAMVTVKTKLKLIKHIISSSPIDLNFFRAKLEILIHRPDLNYSWHKEVISTTTSMN